MFGRFPGVEQAVLYGSRAKGNYRPGSDIDLTLKGDLSYRDLLNIKLALDDLLLPWKIDLSLYSQIDNLALVEHIGRIGKVFLCARLKLLPAELVGRYKPLSEAG